MISRRAFLKSLLGAAALAAFPALPSCSLGGRVVETVYRGEVFDSEGTILNLADWGGWWEEFNWKAVLSNFERDFNCRINYDSAPPYYPKLAAAGVDYPAYDLVSQNAGEALRSRDFYVPAAELAANVPNLSDLWESAVTATGAVWLFGLCGYAYRQDIAAKTPNDFKDLWDEAFQDKRGSYDAGQPLQQIFFLAASQAFGAGQDDAEAGAEAMRKGQPWFVARYTANAQSALSSGRLHIAPLTDAETFWLAERGIPVGWAGWGPLTAPLVQVKNVTRGSKKKRLAYALLNRFCSPEVQERWAAEHFWHPTNRRAAIPPNLSRHGVSNSRDPLAGLWLPDWEWWNANEQPLLEKLSQVLR